jgi:hypothetical protein
LEGFSSWGPYEKTILKDYIKLHLIDKYGPSIPNPEDGRKIISRMASSREAWSVEGV